MKIYTKTGDSGETGLFRGSRVAKHDARVEAYGNVDELNAVLGVLLPEIRAKEIHALLSSIQHDLFAVGADLATPPQQQEDPSLRITPSMVADLESKIDHFEANLPPLQQFILPGGGKSGALLHYARTVCRRAERSITKLKSEQAINLEVLRYMNRLSDLLFVLARFENQTAGVAEVSWQKRS